MKPLTSCKEQISFCIRTVNADFSVNEHFMGFYQTDDTLSATLFKCLTDMAICLGLSITDCRGQCYMMGLQTCQAMLVDSNLWLENKSRGSCMCTAVLTA